MKVNRPRYQELEPRILYSADPVLGLGVPGPDVLENRTVQASGDIASARSIVQQQITHQARSLELIVVNSDVANWDLLLQDIRRSESSTRAFDVVLLDARQDGITQISMALSGRTEITAIHLISHGSAGELNLGSAKLNLGNLNDYADAIGGWRNSLTADADMLFYGCDVAKGAIGKAFLSSLALLTRADVAASDDKTGDAAKGGDWELEHSVGAIETATVASPEAQGTWHGLLAPNTAPVFGPAANGTVTTSFGAVGDDLGWGVALQTDGKILVGGAGNNFSDFTLARYNTDGSLDNTFGTLGKVITDVGGGFDYGGAMALQTDGKIVLGGVSVVSGRYEFGMVRYNTDGSLDTSFGAGGKLTTNVGTGTTNMFGVYSLALQADGKIVAVGDAYNGTTYDIGVVRYNIDGSLDSTFSGDGIQMIDWGDTDKGRWVSLQADGKMVITGIATIANEDIAIARLNTDGTLDTTFSGDGMQTTSVGAGVDWASSSAIQPDGKIVVVGADSNNFAVVRYNTDGSLDTTFDGDGKLTTVHAGGDSLAWGVAIQPDNKIVVSGYSANATQFALARYNTDGSLDTTFSADGKEATLIGSSAYGVNLVLQGDGKIVVVGESDNGSNRDFAMARYTTAGVLDVSFGDHSLNGAPTYTESGAAVVLDSNVEVLDAELTGSNYAGAVLTLTRSGGVNSQDVYGSSGVLSPLTEGGTVVVFGTTIGTVTSNSNGALVLSFNSNATQTLVNATLQALTYANSNDTPPASVQINWSFADGNTGAQGTGGEEVAQGSITVTITAVNDAPTFGPVGNGSVTTELGLVGGTDAAYAITLYDDGKILAAGIGNNFNDFAMTRYNADGSLDATFGTGGKVITDFGLGRFEWVRAVTVLSDGKILVGGIGNNASNNYDFALARYDSNGVLDATFGTGGMVLTDMGRDEYMLGMAVQADGKIIGVGRRHNGSNYDFVFARYNSDGSLDASFDSDGTRVIDNGGEDIGWAVAAQPDGKIVATGSSFVAGSVDIAVMRLNVDGSTDFETYTDIGVGTSDSGNGVVLQADGKIVVGGSMDNTDAPLVRYNTDGSLDTTFSGDGKQIVDLGMQSIVDSLALQSDGKIVAGGFAGGNFLVARYDTSGALDTTFSGDGIQTTPVGTWGKALTIQPDGRVLLAGYLTSGGNTDFSVARFTSAGVLDTTFGGLGLNGAPTYTENGAAVVLDTDVEVFDAELTGSNYAGAVLTLARAGGVNSQDVYGNSGVLAALTEGGNLVVSGTTIGTVTTNSGGTLALTFNSNSTQALVNSTLQAITYANSSDDPPASVQIDWSFSDRNTGLQGTGGALAVTGSTTVTITAVNDNAPVIGAPATALGVEDTVLPIVGISAFDPDGDLSSVTLSATQGNMSVTLAGSSTVTAGANGSSLVTLSGSQTDINTTLGTLSYLGPQDAFGNALITITVADIDGNSSSTGVAVSLSAVNDAPVLVGTLSIGISEGGAPLVSASELQASDVDHTAAQLNYTLITGPANGVLMLDGVALGAGNSFTQAEVNAGRVRYVHDAGETSSDQMMLSLSDGTAPAVPIAFNITVASVDDTPAITALQFTINGGQSVPITAANLAISDPDTATSSLVVDVTQVTHGQFEHIAQAGVAVTQFTVQAVDAGEILFVHDGSVVAPSFVTVISDASSSSAPQAASINFGLPPTPPPPPDPTPPSPADPPPPEPPVETPVVPPEEPPVVSPVTPPEPDLEPDEDAGDDEDEDLDASIPTSRTTPGSTTSPASSGVAGRRSLVMARVGGNSWSAMFEQIAGEAENAGNIINVPIDEINADAVFDPLVVFEEDPTLRRVDGGSREHSTRSMWPSIFRPRLPGDPNDAVVRKDAFSADVVRLGGAVMSLGVVGWVVRSGGLLTSVLTTVPAWRHLDLVPILPTQEVLDPGDSDLIESDEELDAQDMFDPDFKVLGMHP